MTRSRIALLGLAQALGTVLYVALVVLLLTNLPGFDDSKGSDSQTADALQAATVLLLFIVSACISDALVLGYPAVLALSQRIREAIWLVASTVSWLVLMLAGVVFVIAIIDS